MDKIMEEFEVKAKKAGYNITKNLAGNYDCYTTCLLYTGYFFALENSKSKDKEIKKLHETTIAYSGFNDDLGKENAKKDKEIKKLREQVESMKCCSNCKHNNAGYSFGEHLNHCRYCNIQENHPCHDDNWELKERV